MVDGGGQGRLVGLRAPDRAGRRSRNRQVLGRTGNQGVFFRIVTTRYLVVGGRAISPRLSRFRRETGLSLDLSCGTIEYMSPNPHLVLPDRETFIRIVAGKTDRGLARELGCTDMVIARLRDRYGVPRSPRQCGGNTTRWQTNRDYFAEIDTPEKAYILGFLIADGHVTKRGYGVQVSVKESDGDLLRVITQKIGCDAPLKTTINHHDGSRMTRLSFYGKKLVADLNALGLYHDKSTTAIYPAVVPEFERHLVRGLWDGDGYIGRGTFALIGTPALLDGVVDAVQRHTGCVLRRQRAGRDARYHYARGSRRDAPVLGWMYSGASIALARKAEAASNSYWTQAPRA